MFHGSEEHFEHNLAVSQAYQRGIVTSEFQANLVLTLHNIFSLYSSVDSYSAQRNDEMTKIYRHEFPQASVTWQKPEEFLVKVNSDTDLDRWTHLTSITSVIHSCMFNESLVVFIKGNSSPQKWKLCHRFLIPCCSNPQFCFLSYVKYERRS